MLMKIQDNLLIADVNMSEGVLDAWYSMANELLVKIIHI